MIKAVRPVFLIITGLAFALAGSALSPSSLSIGQGNFATTATLVTNTVTSTVIPETDKIPGDTNIILLLGIILVIIIITAIMWHRRDWER